MDFIVQLQRAINDAGISPNALFGETGLYLRRCARVSRHCGYLSHRPMRTHWHVLMQPPYIYLRWKQIKYQFQMAEMFLARSGSMYWYSANQALTRFTS